MTNARFILVAALSMMLLPTTNAFGDQITLANGDRISGEIVLISEGDLRIVTEYSGEIRVDFAKVADMRTDKAGRIALENGDTITGRIDSASQDHVNITSEILQGVKVPRSLFKSLNAPQAMAEPAELEHARELLDQTKASLNETAEKLERKEREIEELTSISKIWKGSFAVGAQLERGNSDTSDLHVEATATRTVPREELRLRFYADYGETEGETDTNQVFGESKLKVFQTDRRYLFGLTNMEYDEMENLDLRAQVFGGPGYDFIKNERTRLLGEVGAGLIGEFFDEEEDGTDETLEASLWLNAEWTQKIFENAEFYQGLTIYPSLGNFGDYRLRSESTVKTPLGEQWAIKMSLIDDYDSDPESEDVKKNDLRFISSMEYNF